MNRLEMLSGSGIMKHARRISGMLSESGNPQSQAMEKIQLSTCVRAYIIRHSGISSHSGGSCHPAGVILGSGHIRHSGIGPYPSFWDLAISAMP
jgi:hypothetical protein